MRLVDCIRANKFHFTTEGELQSAVLSALVAGNFKVSSEVILDRKSRIDFMVEEVGIECKVDGATVEVLRQLHRYAQFPEIQSLVLVTSRSRHLSIPRMLSGKPLAIVFTAEAF